MTAKSRARWRIKFYHAFALGRTIQHLFLDRSDPARDRRHHDAASAVRRYPRPGSFLQVREWIVSSRDARLTVWLPAPLGTFSDQASLGDSTRAGPSGRLVLGRGGPGCSAASPIDLAGG